MPKPKCGRCRNHGVISELKGHRATCPWKDCSCHNCNLMSMRKVLSAKLSTIAKEERKAVELRKTVELSKIAEQNNTIRRRMKGLTNQNNGLGNTDAVANDKGYNPVLSSAVKFSGHGGTMVPSTLARPVPPFLQANTPSLPGKWDAHQQYQPESGAHCTTDSAGIGDRGPYPFQAFDMSRNLNDSNADRSNELDQESDNTEHKDDLSSLDLLCDVAVTQLSKSNVCDFHSSVVTSNIKNVTTQQHDQPMMNSLVNEDKGFSCLVIDHEQTTEDSSSNSSLDSADEVLNSVNEPKPSWPTESMYNDNILSSGSPHQQIYPAMGFGFATTNTYTSSMLPTTHFRQPVMPPQTMGQYTEVMCTRKVTSLSGGTGFEMSYRPPFMYPPMMEYSSFHRGMLCYPYLNNSTEHYTDSTSRF